MIWGIFSCAYLPPVYIYLFEQDFGPFSVWFSFLNVILTDLCTFWTQILSQTCVSQIFSLIRILSFVCLNSGFHSAVLYLVKSSSSVFSLMDHDIDVVSKRSGGHLHSTHLLYPMFPHVRTRITGPSEPGLKSRPTVPSAEHLGPLHALPKFCACSLPPKSPQDGPQASKPPSFRGHTCRHERAGGTLRELACHLHSLTASPNCTVTRSTSVSRTWREPTWHLQTRPD